MTAPTDTREPGYCIICGDFHLVTPVPGHYGGGVCGAPSCVQRLEPPEPYVPGKHHCCGVGGEPKAGHPHYRQCRCGQWYHYNGDLWRKVSHPPAAMRGGADDFWSYGEDEDAASPLGAFFTTVGGWRYLLRWLLGPHRE